MKLEIWCEQSFEPKIRAVHAATVEWPVVPRVGECIIIHDGWCSEKVLAVHHDFTDQLFLIEIQPDTSGEYAKRACQ